MLDRLGFPSVGRHRRFVTAIGIDAVGSGVFMPVSVLYFLVATDLTLVHGPEPIWLALTGVALCGALLTVLLGRVLPLAGGAGDQPGSPDGSRARARDRAVGSLTPWPLGSPTP